VILLATGFSLVMASIAALWATTGGQD